jgi:DNA-binding response OmpR family regulator
MKSLKILLIEDDLDDIELLKDAFNSNKVDTTLKVITTGDLVAPYLDEPDFIPEIVILDFNLPRVHGKEILFHLRKHNNFEKIPVVVFSTSSAQEDIDYAKQNGASAFITKPISIEGFNQAVSTILTCSEKN